MMQRHRHCRFALLNHRLGGNIAVKNIKNVGVLLTTVLLVVGQFLHALPETVELLGLSKGKKKAYVAEVKPKMPDGSSKKNLKLDIFSIDTFEEWETKINNVYDKNWSSATREKLRSALPYDDFQLLMDAYIYSQTKYLKHMPWIKKTPPPAFDKKNVPHYVIKLLPKASFECAVFPDIHGDIQSLLKVMKDLQKKGYLEKSDAFKIVKKNFYMIFLGDYIDRGLYGVEVLGTVMKLSIANPGRVFLLKGNHDDGNSMYDQFIPTEVREKFPDKTETIQYMFYDKIVPLFPEAIFLGDGTTNNYALLCHGGPEAGYDPHKLFASDKKLIGDVLPHDLNVREEFFRILKDKQIKNSDSMEKQSIMFGFTWHDFVNKEELAITSPRKGNIGFSKALYDFLCEYWTKDSDVTIGCTIRGHQHNHTMINELIANNGMYTLWGQNALSKNTLKIPLGSVMTLLVGPDTVIGEAFKYTFATYGILRPSKDAESGWDIERHNVTVL